jgi:hypothetical protein
MYLQARSGPPEECDPQTPRVIYQMPGPRYTLTQGADNTQHGILFMGIHSGKYSLGPKNIFLGDPIARGRMYCLACAGV